MLKVFRHKGVAKKVLWVVSGIIIISFGFGFGISRYGSSFSLSQTAGKVFGRSISLKEYRRNYQNAHDQAVMMHGANVEKIMASMDMDNETWTRIILLKAAENQGLKASDMEVVQFVESTPFFQREGEFDKSLYANLVKNVFRREPRDFEEGLRDQIKIGKLFRPLLSAINFSDEAVRKEYERRNQKTQVSYAILPPESFAKGITATDKDLQAYFNTHREDFVEPEAINATVLTLALDAKASAAEKTKAAALANDMYRKIDAGADLAATAKEYNATIKDTGFFNLNNPSEDVGWSLELLQQLFAAKANDILTPAETSKGYQIVKVAERKPAYTPEFSAIKDKVKESFIKDQSTKSATAKAVELQKLLAEKVKGGAEFAATAKALGMDVKETPFFGQGEYVPEVGMSDDFTAAAFALNKDNRLSSVVITSRWPAILYWTATQAIDEKKFNEVKKDFADALYNEERVHVMNDLIRSLREKANLVNNIETINAQQKNAMKKMRVRR